MRIFYTVLVFILAEATLLCMALNDKLWYKVLISTMVSGLMAFLVYSTML